MKRAFDLLVSLTALIVFSPLMIVIALMICSTSSGPALFRQTRVGFRGEDFTIYKFRSMTVDKNAEKGSFDAGSSLRVTRVGRWLRATKLDELPQLINVLRGDMSVVGPRPEVRKWVEVYPDEWSRIHSVKPGISDPASIMFRHEESILAQSEDPQKLYRDTLLPEKLKLYQQYVDNASLVYDIELIFKTVKSLFSRG